MNKQACFTVLPKDVSALNISGQKLRPWNQKYTFDSDLFTFLTFIVHLLTEEKTSSSHDYN